MEVFWEFLGKLLAVWIVCKLIFCTWMYFREYVFPYFGWRTDLKSYGKWAVVTGATDGIGKSYAKELAKEGFDIVLISRSQEKLDKVKEEIRDTYNVEVKTIEFDFSAVCGYGKIENILNDLDIGVLVNNVGIGYEARGHFLDHPVNVFQKVLTVNLLSAVKMTHMIIKGMIDRQRGIIIHVSSFSGTRPVPMLTIYSSTKAFLDFFARALQTEYSDKGIISQVVMPSFISTKLSKMKESFLVPSADVYVKQALKTTGIAGRTQGYWTHEIQGFIGRFIPSFIMNKLLMAAFKKPTKEL